MDGHFVPNISMGPLVVQALKPVTRLPLDVHLMISRPRDYFDAFIDAGANHITFHVESEGEIGPSIEHLREREVGVGLALSPDTSVSEVLASKLP